MGFFGVKIFFFAAEYFFCDKLSRHYFFLQKQSFLRHKVLTEYLFLPISETDFFLKQICRQKNFPQKKPQQTLQVKCIWMFPYQYLKIYLFLQYSNTCKLELWLSMICHCKIVNIPLFSHIYMYIPSTLTHQAKLYKGAFD